MDAWLQETFSTLAVGAFQQMTDAHTQLASSIKTYVHAASYLESTCTSFHPSALRGATMIMEHDMNSMDVEVAKLHGARTMLAKFRNHYISPIHSLPHEILSSIFTVVLGFSYSKGRVSTTEDVLDYAIILSGVCSRWRRVAYDTPALWAFVPFIFKGQAERPNFVITPARLGLARDFPIDVFVHTKYPTDLQTTVNTLTPYMKRLRSLDLTVQSQHHIDAMLNCWLDNGTPGSLTELRVSMTSYPEAPLFSRTNVDTLERLRLFLQPIRVLELNQVGLDWDPDVFEQLMELLLIRFPFRYCPTTAQFARTLSNCPGLQEISLQKMRFLSADDSVTPQVVTLRSLKMLSLLDLGPLEFQEAVSVISTEGSHLDLFTNYRFGEAGPLEGLVLLAKRTCIDSLRLVSFKNDDLPMHGILASLPDLERLALAGTTLIDSRLDALAERLLFADDGHSSQTPAMPDATHGIRALMFFECMVPNEGLFKDVMAATSDKHFRLRVVNCHLGESKLLSVSEHSETIGEATELGIWLLKNVPRVTFDI